MEIFNNLQEFKKSTNIVLALGNFDGVHLGHRELIAKTVDMAKEINGTPALFTFDPHPMKILQPDASPALLLTREDKIKILEELGIRVLVIATFSREIARLGPEAFICDVLCGTLEARGIVVGYNYTFGHKGQGNPEMLRQKASEFGYRLEVIPPVFAGGQEVSSTLIRQLLSAGDVDKAGQLLGYQPFIRGLVTTGDRRGREIGFPTANLDLPEEILAPANGVYAIKVFVNGDVHFGVANIGTKPTFIQGRPRNLEVHIFDFNQDIYGRQMKVEFLSRLRAEKTFNGPAELVRQINEDCTAARNFVNCRLGHKP